MFPLYVEKFSNSLCIGIVGEIAEEGSGYYIWTHKKFDIGFNGKQIVDVNLTSDAKVKLEPGAKFSFSYEVSHFKETFMANLKSIRHKNLRLENIVFTYCFRKT